MQRMYSSCAKTPAKISSPPWCVRKVATQHAYPLKSTSIHVKKLLFAQIWLENLYCNTGNFLHASFPQKMFVCALIITTKTRFYVCIRRACTYRNTPMLGVNTMEEETTAQKMNAANDILLRQKYHQKLTWPSFAHSFRRSICDSKRSVTQVCISLKHCIELHQNISKIMFKLIARAEACHKQERVGRLGRSPTLQRL